MWAVLAALGYLVLVKPAKKPCSCSTDPSCCDKPKASGARPDVVPDKLATPRDVKVGTAAAGGCVWQTPSGEQYIADCEPNQGELLGRRGSDEGSLFSGESEAEPAPTTQLADVAPGSTRSDRPLVSGTVAGSSQRIKTLRSGRMRGY